MISIRGKRVKPHHRALIRQFCDFVLAQHGIDKQKEPRILIRFININDLLSAADRRDLTKYGAWMHADKGVRYDYVIVVNDATIPRTKTHLITKMKSCLECIGHELTHVKQYVNGEMRDFADGDVWYKGERYTDWEREEKYYLSLWEVEAYGFEKGLYKVFRMKSA